MPVRKREEVQDVLRSAIAVTPAGRSPMQGIPRPAGSRAWGGSKSASNRDVEIGIEPGQGFMVRALDERGMVFEETKSKSLGEALTTLERKIAELDD